MKRKYRYWALKKIPNVRPIPLVGNFLDLWLMKATMPQIEQRICKQLPDEPLIGAYYGTEPCLIVQDPQYIKTITTKDFYYFCNREVSDYVHKEYLSKNLFQTYGDNWKVLRQNLTPMFSSAKMKKMFSLIDQCSRQFEKVLDEQTEISKVLDVRNWFGRFTMDCIGSCAFGVNTEAMVEPNNPFRNIGDAFFQVTYQRFLKIHTRAIWPRIFYSLGMEVNPGQLSEFFTSFLGGVFAKRKEPSLRNDFIDLIMTFNNKKYITGDSMHNLKINSKDKIKLDVDHNLLSAQCFIFFVAGYETSATTASFTLFELAKDSKSQDKARVEVDAFLRKHEGVLDYECVNELPFLEQCIDETLRLYPVLGIITREVSEKYTFPDIKLTLEKGTRVHLPVFHMHRNPKYFPEPDTFRPERFSPEEKRNIIPYTYFPFGEGPRICIGMRFAKMQMLSGLVTVLKKYKVELAEGRSGNIDFEPKAFVTQCKHSINLKFTPRTDPIMYAST